MLTFQLRNKILHIWPVVILIKQLFLKFHTKTCKMHGWHFYFLAKLQYLQKPSCRKQHMIGQSYSPEFYVLIVCFLFLYMFIFWFTVLVYLFCGFFDGIGSLVCAFAPICLRTLKFPFVCLTFFWHFSFVLYDVYCLLLCKCCVCVLNKFHNICFLGDCYVQILHFCLSFFELFFPHNIYIVYFLKKGEKTNLMVIVLENHYILFSFMVHS